MLSWSNQAEIAAALLKEHPDIDRLSLSHDHLLQLILALPDFRDRPHPPTSHHLNHILWTWMRLADSDAGEKGRRRA